MLCCYFLISGAARAGGRAHCASCHCSSCAGDDAAISAISRGVSCAVSCAVIRAGGAVDSSLSIDPTTFGKWLTASDQIGETPPFLSGYKIPRGFNISPCAPDHPNFETQLKRFCFNNRAVMGPDPRAGGVTIDERVALVRYYAAKYELSAVNPMNISADWFTHPSTSADPGANTINILIGMARWRLELDRVDAAAKIEALNWRVKPDSLPSSTIVAAKLVNQIIMLNTYREQRMVDFWFPDAPLWTLALLDGCADPQKRLSSSNQFCCFAEVRGCRKGPR